MKASYLFIFSIFLFFSCATSQNTVSPDTKRKIDELRTLINLSPDQVKKIVGVETTFINKSKELPSANDSRLTKLKQKRTRSYQNILSREQFIKFQAIDKDLIQQVPVRFDKN